MTCRGAPSHGPSSRSGAGGSCSVPLTTAELASLTRNSEAALRRSLEASHQSFLQHQGYSCQQQHQAAWPRRPLLLGASADNECGYNVSDCNGFPFARASSSSSSCSSSCSSSGSSSSDSGARSISSSGGCASGSGIATCSKSTGSFAVARGGRVSCGRACSHPYGGCSACGSSLSSPVPVAPPTPPQLCDMASPPRECILLTCRGLCLSADTTGRLALHIWTRVEGMARLLLSVRPDAAAVAPALACGGWSAAAAAAAGLRVFAVAAVWVAAKLEERRQEVPGSGALAVAARSTPAVLAAAELRILQWCDWSPCAGFVPDESHLLTWGP
ncbi:hypothetical protein HYH02_007372 [Chlamydomonas schloesseri]|uniref:Uncharacterized protein n=1 Tax=Chlamydomonas schloesseri TaxID=2026947 RepID=A0A835WIL3_9CHLO|nr:hypothetical protein HYH02_007372 [Chlamydomonas schloesseri]|eukprot:KAG2447919.1 hypothetical protein HYH02_007372 [Chlamydomonas schloesseri]